MSGSVTPRNGAVAVSRASRPPIGAMAASRVSGCVLISILMLSAPNDERNRVPPAEARNQVKSTMRMPSSANGLARFDGLPARVASGFAAITGVSRGVGVSTLAASSFRRGARRPGAQLVPVAIHLLVA